MNKIINLTAGNAPPECCDINCSKAMLGECYCRVVQTQEKVGDKTVKALDNARMMEEFWHDQWQSNIGLFRCVKCNSKVNWLRQIHEERAFVCMSCYEKWVDAKNAQIIQFVKDTFDYETDEDVQTLLKELQRT